MTLLPIPKDVNILSGEPCSKIFNEETVTFGRLYGMTFLRTAKFNLAPERVFVGGKVGDREISQHLVLLGRGPK